MAGALATPVVAKPLPGRRFDHLFFSAASILIIVSVFIGFAPTYFLAGVFHAHLPNIVIHFHGAVFSCWILLLALQTTLVSAHRTDIHRRVGPFGFALACLMVILGMLAGASLLVRHIAPRGFDARTFFIVPFSEMIMFAVLVFLAYRARKDAGAHKRFILIATVALLGPAFARFHISFLYRRFLAPLLVSYCFLLLVAVYDLWSTHKLHRATLCGCLLVIGVGIVRLPFAHTSAWQLFASWVQAHSRWLA